MKTELWNSSVSTTGRTVKAGSSLNGMIAQSVEQLEYGQRVVGSSPTHALISHGKADSDGLNAVYRMQKESRNTEGLKLAPTSFLGLRGNIVIID